MGISLEGPSINIPYPLKIFNFLKYCHENFFKTLFNFFKPCIEENALILLLSWAGYRSIYDRQIKMQYKAHQNLD